MVAELRQSIKDKRVLAAFARVPRERFVPHRLRHQAYANAPLAIAYGQTISQPLVVAIMLETLDLRGSEKVLDVGTGSGYQAALLAELAAEVVTVERIPALARSAGAALKDLGYGRVRVEVAREVLGRPEDG